MWSRSSDRLINAQLIAFLAIALSAPFWIETVGLYPYIGVEIAIWSIYALGFNLLLGHSGLPSFGHGAFFGVGAYAFGLAQQKLGLGLAGCLAIAVLAAAISGALVAAFISHRRGIYYAFMTIAFGQVFWFVAIKTHSVTGGEDGLLKIARLPIDLGPWRIELLDNTALYYFVVTLLGLAILALWRLVHSPYGHVLSAIKQNEMRAAFAGYSVWHYKFSVFTLSAAIAGLAGALLAMAQSSAFPDVMSLHYSGYVVMMTLVGGGLVSFWGPLIGVVVFLLSRDLIGSVTNAWMLWFGLLFMALVLFKPEGLAGIAQDLARSGRRSRSTAQGWARLRLIFGRG